MTIEKIGSDVAESIQTREFFRKAAEDMSQVVARHSLVISPDFDQNLFEKAVSKGDEATAKALAEAVIIDDLNLRANIQHLSPEQIELNGEFFDAVAIAVAKPELLEKEMNLSPVTKKALSNFTERLLNAIDQKVFGIPKDKKEALALSRGRKKTIKLAVISTIALALWACGIPSVVGGISSPDGGPLPETATAFMPETSTQAPVATQAPTETATATEAQVANPTAEEVADYTPETVPDKFNFFNHEWNKTTDAEGKDVWKTSDEGMENVSYRFVTLYQHYIKDMFVEQTDLGRFHLLVTPLAPFRLKFPGNEQERTQIGETIINSYLLPKMGDPEAIAAIKKGGEVYSVYGDKPRCTLPSGVSGTKEPIYSEDQSVRIGELISLRGEGYAEAGPFINKDGSVVFGFYVIKEWREINTKSRDLPQYQPGIPELVLSGNILTPASLFLPEINKVDTQPLADYLGQVSASEWFDGWVQN